MTGRKEGSILKIELVVADECLLPTLLKDESLIRVRIGIQHDFDDILDLCSGKLSNDEIAFVHRLWNDDEFPRNFIRRGEDLIITAREE